MSAQLTFWYKRRDVLKYKDGSKETVVECEDCFNLYDVVRGWWKDMDTFVVMLKDGHEESMEKELPDKVKSDMLKQNKDIPRERRWSASYLELHAIDIDRFRMASELAIPKVEQMIVQRPSFLKPPVSTKTKLDMVDVTTNNTSTDNPATPTMAVVKEEIQTEVQTEVQDEVQTEVQTEIPSE